MKSKLIKALSAILLISSPLLSGQETKFETLTLKSGKVYEQVTVTKATNFELRILHKTGMAAVPLSELSPDLQKAYGYDPEAAAIAEEERAAIQAKAAKIAALTRQMQADQAEAAALSEKSNQMLKEMAIGVVFTIDQAGRVSLGNARAIQRVKGSLEGAKTTLGAESGTIGVIGLTGRADGETWSGTLYPCGTFSYTTVAGAARTVKKYATTMEGAKEELMKNE